MRREKREQESVNLTWFVVMLKTRLLASQRLGDPYGPSRREGIGKGRGHKRSSVQRGVGKGVKRGLKEKYRNLNLVFYLQGHMEANERIGEERGDRGEDEADQHIHTNAKIY